MSECESAEAEAPPSVTDEATTKAERKRVRHRKKQIYERILRQMEFYFSDANLTKDRYLSELTQASPDVPLDVFLKFNKIRALTHDVADIVKAVRSSDQLVCSDDGLKVRRKTPVEPYDAEQRTVYVESVPASASLDWLRSIFKDYGPVAYISLPKFKDSQRIKGFAFIEFEKPEDAQKCLNAFTKMGCKLPTSMPPEELSTIKMFAADQPQDEKAEKDVSTVEESKSLVKEEKEGVSKEEVQPKKEEGDEPPRKRQKRHNKKSRRSVDSKNTGELNVSSDKDVSASEEAMKSLNTSVEDADKVVEAEKKEGASSQEDTPGADGKPSKKKSRKRTAKERNKSKISTKKNETPIGAMWGLQVLSKQEWRVLRNKYLNLQRKRMKELKTSLRMRGIPHSATPGEPHKKTEKEGATKEGAAAGAGPERVPGVFVRVELPEPCLDVRLTKRQVRSNVRVQHVDVKEGQREMIVRFDAADAATQYCSSGIYASACVLSAAESEQQWRRAEEARGAGADSRRARGRTRLLQRAAAAAGLQPAAPEPACLDPAPDHMRWD